MRTKRQIINNILFGAVLALGGSSSIPVFADGDSNADADGGFHKTVATSAAVMIRVPINDRGEENTNASEMRLVTGSGQAGAPADYAAVWNASIDVSKQPVVNGNRDSSTNGYWGWNSWYGYGWQNNYYYGYRPYYSYYNSYYNYGNPYYYNYYYGYNYPYYGYRYYYYPRYW